MRRRPTRRKGRPQQAAQQVSSSCSTSRPAWATAAFGQWSCRHAWRPLARRHSRHATAEQNQQPLNEETSRRAASEACAPDVYWRILAAELGTHDARIQLLLLCTQAKHGWRRSGEFAAAHRLRRAWQCGSAAVRQCSCSCSAAGRQFDRTARAGIVSCSA